MTVDKDTILQQFEDLKEKTMILLDERAKLVSDSEELRTARREIEEKAWAAEESVKSLTAELEEIKNKYETADAELQTKTEELDTLKSDSSSLVGEKDAAIAEIIRERDELKAEMNEITSKLERVSELFREASAEKDKLAEKVDISDLLSIYIILIENIFGGKPHARVLYTLHNTKTAITRKNLVSSTGIMPTAVLKAIHDLRNAELVNYDDETEEVTLLKDIM
ncbi:MAG: hypothetical protein ACTSUB_01300 [Candidatus Thorarchaeota archaeon]